MAAAILGVRDASIRAALKLFRTKQTESVLKNPDPRAS
jgi:phosphoribosylcarboxyaminoimidazole (NCAIR) mutase